MKVRSSASLPDTVVQQVLANHAGQTLLHLVRLGPFCRGFGLHGGRGSHFFAGGVWQISFAVVFTRGHCGGGGGRVRQHTSRLDSLRKRGRRRCNKELLPTFSDVIQKCIFSLLNDILFSLFHLIPTVFPVAFRDVF